MSSQISSKRAALGLAACALLAACSSQPTHKGPPPPPAVAPGVAAPAKGRWDVEGDDHGRQMLPATELEVAESSLAVQAERVDDGRQASADPARDDLVEQREGVLRRVQVVPAAADDAAQVVGGHDLSGAIVRARPGRLARPAGPDQDH